MDTTISAPQHPRGRLRWFVLGISPLLYYLLAAAVAAAVLAAFNQGGPKRFGLGEFFLLSTGVFALCCAGLWWRYRRELPTTRRVRSWPRAVAGVFALWLAVIAVSATLSFAFGIDTTQFDQYADTYRGIMAEAGLGLSLLLMIGLAPLLEEFAFRKWMLSLLPHSIGLTASFIVAGIAFIALHGPASWWHASVLAVLTAALSWLWWRTRSLRLCWLMHAGNNALAMLPLLVPLPG